MKKINFGLLILLAMLIYLPGCTNRVNKNDKNVNTDTSAIQRNIKPMNLYILKKLSGGMGTGSAPSINFLTNHSSKIRSPGDYAMVSL